MDLDNILKATAIIGILVITISVFYYLMIFLPTKDEKLVNFREGTNNEGPSEEGEEDNILLRYIGETVEVQNYEVSVRGIVFEDGDRIHKERLERLGGLGIPEFSVNYYKDTYKMVVPYIVIKNLSTTKVLKFDPKYFSIIAKPGYVYAHKSPSGDYDGGTLIGGEIEPGHSVSGWYGFELPKGYDEGREIFLEILLPNIPKILRFTILLPN